MEKQKSNKALKIAMVLFIVLLAIDQVSKMFAVNTNIDTTVIENIFNLKLIFNNGGVFGIGQGSNPLTFIIPDIIVLGIIIRFIFLQKERMDRVTVFALFTVLAGGVGNLLDRIFRGAVVDFFALFPNNNLPVFNFSDIYIVIGWVVLAFVFAKYTYQEIKNRKK